MNSFKRLTNKLLETASRAADGLIFTEKELHAELMRYAEIISKEFEYFRDLTDLEKERFLQRVYHFRKSKRFIYTGLDPQDEIEILISACAVQITFGLRRYKMPFFKEIHVLADQYQLGINQQEWIGHVNRTGIYLSWKHFLLGYSSNNDHYNVGLHEMAHALEYVNFLGFFGSDEFEEDGGAVHPPLALAYADSSVDVVYGKQASTKLTRVRIDPRRVASEARLWRPSGRTGVRTGPARLVTADSAPVQAFISKGRVVLYRPDAQFRYVVLENGVWSPERMIQLDDKLTSEQLLRELHRTVDDQGADDTQGTEQ